MRDWIYVDDNCRAIDKVVRCGEIGEIYNICSCYEISNVELVKTISKLMNKKAKIKYVEDRKGHDKKYSMSYEKIVKELNWLPKHSFLDGLRKTLAWYSKNK